MNSVAAMEIVNTKNLAGSILETLVYFDIFQYPLPRQDIKNFLSQPVTDADLEASLEDLLSQKIIFLHGQFYSLRPDAYYAEKRVRGSGRATSLLPRAKRIARFLHNFPFVRGVAISGSLSKNYIEGKADFDFFIIAKKNRLWIARSFMHLFKKLTYLTASQHLFCMNFFVDEAALHQDERNIYVATEVITLLPVTGPACDQFFQVNAWVREWFPNYELTDKNVQAKESSLKKLVEWFFKGNAGDSLDNYLFRLTSKRWKTKEAKKSRNLKGKVMNLLTGKHFARSNPEFFQERIVGAYKEKLADLKNRWPELFC
jgi:hypothetical protein